MDENISEVISKFSEILNNKENIPDDMKEMINNNLFFKKKNS